MFILKKDFIEELKEKIKVKTSEEVFDLHEQTRNQCPYVDEVIRNIKYAQSYASDGLKCDEEDIEKCIEYHDNIDTALNCLESDMEDIRNNIISIRDWGEEWKQLCKNLINDYLSDNEEFKEQYFSGYRL